MYYFHYQEVFSHLSALAESFAVIQQPTSNHFQTNFEFKVNCQSNPIQSAIRSDPSNPIRALLMAEMIALWLEGTCNGEGGKG